jgi:2-alkyl-3-oxoalkanoate reductase
MKLLVTGASGFLGTHVVTHALSRGHEVRALVRPATAAEGLCWNGPVEQVRADLRSDRGLAEALEGIDAVIHLAAAKSGDIYTQLAGTVVATENLLAAMTRCGVSRIVLTSSFAVYDYRRIRAWSVLDEQTATESRPLDRDEYCQTKLIQERIVREHTGVADWKWTVLRPGVIYGPGETWTARLGIRISEQWWVRIGAWAKLPLTYVENCAEAVVACVENDSTAGQILNVVDDDAPSQRRYVAELRRRMQPRPRVVPISRTAMGLIIAAAGVTNRLVFGGRARLPQILRPASLQARAKPLRYTNRRLKEATGWSPRYALDQALDRCFSPARPSPSAPNRGDAVLTEAAST